MKNLFARTLAFTTALALSTTLAGCGAKTSAPASTPAPAADSAQTKESAAPETTPAAETTPATEAAPEASGSDLDYVTGKGTLVVGITDFEPMDYKDANGEWIGFDADMAKAFAESLGVSVEFVEIDWDNKILELDGKTIDCVWNGMTLTDEVKSAMECSKPYCNNAQVVVAPAANADNFKDKTKLADYNFAVENGSAAVAEAKALNLNITAVDTQATALMEVSSGTSDAAIIDSLMAAAMVGEGTGYADLTYTIGLNDEEYGVGFRKGSELAAKLNDFFDASLADGSMAETAEKYGVQAALVK